MNETVREFEIPVEEAEILRAHVALLKTKLDEERKWREELGDLSIDQQVEIERLKQALTDLEETSRRPFTSVEQLGYLARRALGTL